ncbi:type VI secretion system protein TssA [Pseudomonas sp. NPDC090233]|uniref:type VI secretion system protein TssA n=1 Tax=Pseudomonas sp. NPDC090233 TaxID=3364479 RepID=UPI00383AB644
MHLPSHLAHLAEPLSTDCPCGESLEYDADYLVLEVEVQGRPEVEYGSTLTEAIAPDWKRVHPLTLALTSRSRDLRLAVHLARAELHLHGFAGLAAGLVLIEGLLVDHWQHVHPQLDPDDDNDPQQRVNILASLCDEAGLLQELRAAPLVEAASLGRVSLRDIDLANGDASDADPAFASRAMIDAVFRQAGHEHLQAVLEHLEQALKSSQHIEALLTERVGFTCAIDMGALPAMLLRAAEALRQRLPQAPGEQPHQAPQSATGGLRMQGDITCREDVRQGLLAICTYFAVHEPTSPVPLLLQRACKLLDLNFIELLQDLAPDGLDQMAKVSGIRYDDH